MTLNTKCSSLETRLQYHSASVCVICHNGDFSRYEIDDNLNTVKTVQVHKLNYFHLNSGKVIVFCDSCLYDLKGKIGK